MSVSALGTKIIRINNKFTALDADIRATITTNDSIRDRALTRLNALITVVNRHLEQEFRNLNNQGDS